MPDELIADRYRLGDRIGSGAMGVVWRARDERLGRTVAVKQVSLPAGSAQDGSDDTHRRVMREGRLIARLHHPNAISVFDVVEHQGRPWLVMEYLPSRDLAHVLSERTLDPLEVARIGGQVAAALGAAHDAGIVHRDVKPGNILIGDEGTVKVTDFGISRAVDEVTLTSAGMVAGTPAYLAPEVARGARADFRSDAWSLGASLYAALEGRPPFGHGDNALAQLHRVASGSIDPPQQCGILTPVVLRLLQPDADRRPQVAQVRDELQRIRSADAVTGSVAEPMTPALPQSFPAAALPTTPAPTTPTTRRPPRRPAAAAAGSAGGPAVRSAGGPGTPGPPPVGSPPGGPPDRDPSGRDPSGRDLPGRDLPDRGSGRHPSAAGPTPAGPTAAGPTAAGPTAAGPTAAGPTSADPTSMADDPPRSPRRRRTLLGVAAAVLVVAVAVTLLVLGARSTPSATIGAGASTTPGASDTTGGSTDTDSPSTGTEDGASSTADGSDGSDETAQQQAITSYYGLIPGQLQDGWAQLTPSYQRNTAGGFSGYSAFWSKLQSTAVRGVSSPSPGSVDATVTYTYPGGRTVDERTLFRMVQQDGRWKIDGSTVLSSRSR